MNTTSDSTGESIGSQSIGGFAYGLGLSIAVFIIFMIVTYISYKCRRQPPSHAAATTAFRRRRRSTTTTYTDSTDDDSSPSIDICIQRINGLDPAILSSYPELTFNPQKSGGGGGGGGCAICLADYKDCDLQRLLPDCGHVFHLKCVDVWLVRNASCPICRKSPLQLQGGVQTSVPVAVPPP